MEHTKHEITGFIRERRCHGKHLSFLTVLYDDGPPLKAAFQRAFFQDDPELFPTKASDIPYGARVRIVAAKISFDQPWVVLSWEMLEEHPRTQALQHAAEPDQGISWGKYLQARAEMYLQFNHERAKSLHEKPGAKTNQPKRTLLLETNDFSNQGSIERKGKRAEIFAKWIVDNLFPGSDRGAYRALDVAGGKGQLTVELSKHGVLSTVVDPMIRSKRALKRLHQSRRHFADGVNGVPHFLATSFGQDEASAVLVDKYDCLVGLHPDECTEDILEMALQEHKAVAIVPCCVFPSLFPARALRNGKPVRTYDEFLAFLLEKDPRLCIAALPFHGKNQVIYLPSMPPQAQATDTEEAKTVQL